MIGQSTIHPNSTFPFHFSLPLRKSKKPVRNQKNVINLFEKCNEKKKINAGIKKWGGVSEEEKTEFIVRETTGYGLINYPYTANTISLSIQSLAHTTFSSYAKIPSKPSSYFNNNKTQKIILICSPMTYLYVIHLLFFVYACSEGND